MLRRMERVSSAVPAVSSDDTGSHCASSDQVHGDGAVAAWLLAQHADQDPPLQRRCLDLMRVAPETEVSPSHIAYLTDRVMLAEGESQTSTLVGK